jgi:diguanylate cyclase (GGDEF)-like protein
MTDPIRILLVEDNPGDALLIREMLRDAGADRFALTHVVRLDEAVHRLATAPFDIVLLDLSLPDGHGLETLSRCKAHASGIAIVVLTGLNDESLALRAVQEGAQDYLVKGTLDGALLTRAVRYAIERHRMLAQLDGARQLEHYLANHDAVTGLPNRQLYYHRLGDALNAARREGHAVAVLFLDLDDLKSLNDSLGHDIGDQLLRVVATRLTDVMGEQNTAARFGGDEFTFLLPRVTDLESLPGVAQSLLDAVAAPITIDEHTIFVTGSVGVSEFPGDGDDLDTMLRNADMAMYAAKSAGRNTFQFFTPSMNRRAMLRLDTEKRLRQALDNDEIVVYYQPKVDARTSRIAGMEALARWRQPEGGIVEPAEFIPLAEETGLILPLGARVLDLACRQAQAWQLAGLPPLRMSVNLSTRQLQRRASARQSSTHPLSLVSDALDASGLPAQYLELEVTESVFLRDPEFALSVLGSMREMGAHIAIDDFGTGYSSFKYLKMLPVETIKIDRTFIRLIGKHERDTALTAAIIAMAHSLGMQVVAEGVETVEQWKCLRQLQCDQMQGYLFSAAVSANEATAMLADHARKLTTAA